MSTETPRTDEAAQCAEVVHQDSHTEEWVDAAFARQLERELSRVTEERDGFRQAMKDARHDLHIACDNLCAVVKDRDAALRRVRELESLATGNECTADGGTWVEVFISNDRLSPEKVAATLGLAFPDRLDAAEKGEK